MPDFVLNGAAYGSVASMLMQHGFHAGALRPYLGEDKATGTPVRNRYGQQVSYVLNERGVAVPTANAALLRRDDWKEIDRAVTASAAPRLRAVGDLLGRGLRYSISNGLGKTVLETAAQSDLDPASVSMDGLREGTSDRPAYTLTNLPLPIIHKDFEFSARQLAASRSDGSPLDMSAPELAARQVAEEAEKLLVGVSSVADQFTYGGGTVYGYTDFPSRNTRTITSPAASGWTGATTLSDVLGLKSDSQDDNFYGPWVLYCSSSWDRYMDGDYSTSKGEGTLRQRLRLIEGVEDVRTLSHLTGYDLVLVQMTSDVAREVVGMEVTTVQWEEKGGMQVKFKVMAIMVPNLRADYSGRCGIAHGTTA